MVAVPGQSVYHATKFAVRGFTESLALEMKATNPNLQIHCVHPGHIGTNIAATARMNDEDFQRDENTRNSIFTRNAPQTQKEMGDLFREGGMHPSKAAQIILNGVKKNKVGYSLVWMPNFWIYLKDFFQNIIIRLGPFLCPF